MRLLLRRIYNKIDQLVQRAGSRPIEKRAFKNKKPTLIAGLHKPWRAGTFSSCFLINKPYFKIATFGIESRSLVTSCKPSLKERISKSWSYQTFNTKLHLYYFGWALFLGISTFLFGFENMCFKYYFSCAYSILLSSWPFLPVFREKPYIRLFGIIGCLLFTILNGAMFVYIVQDYLNGYFPFSESNFVLQTPALYFYDIFSLEIFADGDSISGNSSKISPGREHIAKLTQVVNFSFLGAGAGAGTHAGILGISPKYAGASLLKINKTIWGPKAPLTVTKVLVSTQKGKWLVGGVSGLVSGAYAFQQIFSDVPPPPSGGVF